MVEGLDRRHRLVESAAEAPQCHDGVHLEDMENKPHAKMKRRTKEEFASPFKATGCPSTRPEKNILLVHRPQVLTESVFVFFKIEDGRSTDALKSLTGS